MSVIIKNKYTGNYDSVGLHRLDDDDDRNYYTDKYPFSSTPVYEHVPFYKILKEYYDEEKNLIYGQEVMYYVDDSLDNTSYKESDLVDSDVISSRTSLTYDSSDDNNDDYEDKDDDIIYTRTQNKFFYT